MNNTHLNPFETAARLYCEKVGDARSCGHAEGSRAVRESEVEAYLVKRVKALGGEVRKVKWIGRRGAPDRFCMFPDRPAVWVELKRPGQKAEPHQVREHLRMWTRGQAVVVLDSIEAIDRWIEG